jgi:hypothetical protein
MSLHGKRGKPATKRDQIAQQQKWWLIIGGVAGGIFTLLIAMWLRGWIG